MAEEEEVAVEEAANLAEIAISVAEEAAVAEEANASSAAEEAGVIVVALRAVEAAEQAGVEVANRMEATNLHIPKVLSTTDERVLMVK